MFKLDICHSSISENDQEEENDVELEEYQESITEVVHDLEKDLEHNIAALFLKKKVFSSYLRVRFRILYNSFCN